MKPILIVKLGSTFPSVIEKKGDFEVLLKQGLGFSDPAYQVVSPPEGQVLPDPNEFSAILITGSHAYVTDHSEWSVRTADWIPGAVDSGVVLLGICYGHQLLAEAMGGKADFNPNGKEFGTVEIRLHQAAETDPLFRGFPSSFLAHATHSQSVIQLPPGGKRLASNDMDSNQAFSIGQSAWGLQFHPEYTAEVTRDYIREHFDLLTQEGRDPQALLQTVQEVDFGNLFFDRLRQLIERSDS